MLDRVIVRVAMRRSTLTALLLAALCPSPAWAGEDAGSTQTVDTDDPKAVAQQKFTEALERFDAGDYETALDLFRRSYSLVPSPNTRLMQARTLKEMGEMGEAYATYERALVEAELAATEEERYTDTAAAVREELAELRPKVGLVVVNIDGDPPSDAQLRVNGRLVLKRDWNRPIAVSPGPVEIALRPPRGDPSEARTEVTAGSTERVELEYQPPLGEDAAAAPSGPEEDEAKGEPDPNLRLGAYIAGGVGAAGVITFTTLLIVDGNDTLKTVSMVTGIVGIGVGIGLFIASERSASPGKPASASLVIGPGSVAVGGTFY